MVEWKGEEGEREVGCGLFAKQWTSALLLIPLPFKVTRVMALIPSNLGGIDCTGRGGVDRGITLRSELILDGPEPVRFHTNR